MLYEELALHAHRVFQTLENDQRPKGICGLYPSQMTGAYGILVLAGTTDPADLTFPSADNTSTFALYLKYFPTRPGQLFMKALPWNW